MVEREIIAALVKRMTRACDRTKANRNGTVSVTSIDWHGLMDLADEARAVLSRHQDQGHD